MDGAQILVVEDEAVVAMDIQIKLMNMGYSVVALIRSGEEAVQTASEMCPDLILMDIRLQSEMDGVTAAACIQASNPTPVVYMTAHGDQETLGRARTTEPRSYIIKPFDEQEFQVTIEAALNVQHRVVIRENSEREYANAMEGAVKLAQRQQELSALNSAFQKHLRAIAGGSRDSQAFPRYVKNIVNQAQQSLDKLNYQLQDEPFQNGSLPIDDLTLDYTNADAETSS